MVVFEVGRPTPDVVAPLVAAQIKDIEDKNLCFSPAYIHSHWEVRLLCCCGLLRWYSNSLLRDSDVD